jgi:hypothetical protein
MQYVLLSKVAKHMIHETFIVQSTYSTILIISFPCSLRVSSSLHMMTHTSVRNSTRGELHACTICMANKQALKLAISCIYLGGEPEHHVMPVHLPRPHDLRREARGFTAPVHAAALAPDAAEPVARVELHAGLVRPQLHRPPRRAVPDARRHPRRSWCRSPRRRGAGARPGARKS